MALVVVLVACATSPETRFYSLEVRPAEGPPAALEGAPVMIADVELPPTLERRQMVHRTGSRAVDIREFERWSGPFDLMIRRTLALDLASRLEHGAVVLPGQPVPADGARPIVIVIDAFTPGPGRAVVLEAHWFLSDREDNMQLGRRESIRVEIASPVSASAAAAAMSDALARLAERMADALAAR